jgi:lipoprotein-anchoring transpeptidase ErfK/SrfK
VDLKLHYRPPRQSKIIPEAFERLSKRRNPRRNPLIAVLVLALAGLIAWIWWTQRKASTASTVAATNQPAPQTLPSQVKKDDPVASAPAQPSATPQPLETDPDTDIRLQVALARLGFSPGAIDGIMGPQTRSALRFFQKARNLRVSGVLDSATTPHLPLSAPLYTNYTVTASDLARLRPLGRTWLAKSRQDKLDFETIVELLAEKTQSDEDLIWRLNPELDWKTVQAGAIIKLADVPIPAPQGRAALSRIFLGQRILQVFDQENRIIAHLPCSIGQRVEKRPTGALYVTSIVPNPNYTFDPATFPESPEAQQVGRKLILQPGPNNPVGTVWIGLDRPGYGIHGTPQPEKVGRTESHGCFRLANWNAEHLLKLTWIGMPVYVEE